MTRDISRRFDKMTEDFRDEILYDLQKIINVQGVYDHVSVATRGDADVGSLTLFLTDDRGTFTEVNDPKEGGPQEVWSYLTDLNLDHFQLAVIFLDNLNVKREKSIAD